MGLLCKVLGHKFEALPLSGGVVRCVRCQTKSLSITEQMKKIAQGEIEYASRVSAVTSPLEGVSEEEFTKARREAHEEGKAPPPLGVSMLGLIGEDGKQPPGMTWPPGSLPRAGEGDLFAVRIIRVRALLADRNTTISKLRSKNERLWRRQRRLHKEIKELHEMIDAVPHEVRMACLKATVEDVAKVEGMMSWPWLVPDDDDVVKDQTLVGGTA